MKIVRTASLGFNFTSFYKKKMSAYILEQKNDSTYLEKP